MLIRYLRNLNSGRLILWCYFIWHLVVLVFSAHNDFADNSREDFHRAGVPPPWRPRLRQPRLNEPKAVTEP